MRMPLCGSQVNGGVALLHDVIRVLVADEQPRVRQGLVTVLDAAPDVEIVGEADDGAEAVAGAAGLRPDVVVIDAAIPVMDGVEATRRIAADDHRVAAPVRILVLAAGPCDRVVHDALRAGASGFLPKDAAPRELLGAVRAIAAGGAWLQPVVARGLLAERADPAALLARLTRREAEVLTLIARGLTNTEIAARLHVGMVTVKTHVGRIFMKLGLRDRVHAVVTAYETGLVVPGR